MILYFKGGEDGDWGRLDRRYRAVPMLEVNV
jgi:hypothetical protein